MYAHRTAKLPVPVHIPRGNSHKVTAVIELKRPLFYLYGGAAAVLALLLLIRGDAAAQGVRDGIGLCVTSVIPALFPFFAASQLLVSLGAAEALGRAAGPLFRRLFGMDGAAAAAYARLLTEVRRSSRDARQERASAHARRRLIAASSAASAGT